MKKLKATEIKNGMVFQVLSEEPNIGLGFLPNDQFTFVKVPIGTMVEVTKKPFKELGFQVINWKIQGIDKEFQSHWITFKKHTKWIE